MRKLKTNLAAGLGAATLMAASASPAMARDDGRNNIGAVEVIAGAAILAGVIAVLSKDKDHDDRYDRRYRNSRYDNDYRRDNYRYNDYRGNGYRNRGNTRYAIEQCVYAVERRASRYGYADVRTINQVQNKSDGYRVRGSVAVQDRYSRKRRKNNRNDYASTSFSCRFRDGRVDDVAIGKLR